MQRNFHIDKLTKWAILDSFTWIPTFCIQSQPVLFAQRENSFHYIERLPSYEIPSEETTLREDSILRRNFYRSRGHVYHISC